MSWRDNSSSSNRSSTNDGNGGSRNASGGVSGTGGGGGGWGAGRDKGGSKYMFRGMGKNKQGNWNTGGVITGFGSLNGGIMPVGGMKPKNMGIPQPAAAPIGPIAQPPMPSIPGMVPPIDDGIPPGTVTDYFSQPVRMDPGILGQMLNGLNPKSSFSNPNGNYPAQFNGGGPGNSFTGMGSTDPRRGYGNDMFGASMFGGGLRQNNKGAGAGGRGLGNGGRNGGGWGGGGGGGW